MEQCRNHRKLKPLAYQDLKKPDLGVVFFLVKEVVTMGGKPNSMTDFCGSLPELGKEKFFRPFRKKQHIINRQKQKIWYL